MSRKLLKEQWDTFKIVIPRDAPETQREEMRKAFYAGAGAFRDIVFRVLTPDSEPTQADLDNMTSLHNELSEFLDEQRAKIGGTQFRIGQA